MKLKKHLHPCWGRIREPAKEDIVRIFRPLLYGRVWKKITTNVERPVEAIIDNDVFVNMTEELQKR